MCRLLARFISLPLTPSYRTSFRALLLNGSLSPRALPNASPTVPAAVNDICSDASSIRSRTTPRKRKSSVARGEGEGEGDTRPGRSPLNHCSSWRGHRTTWSRSAFRDRGVRAFHNPHDNATDDEAKQQQQQQQQKEEEEEEEEDSCFESWLQRNPLPPTRGSSSETAQLHPTASPSLPYSSTNEYGRNEGSPMITQRPKSGGGDGGGGGGGGGHEARQQAPCVYVAGVGPPGSVSPSREFRVSELVSVLEQLLLYPRVDWDVRKLAWVSYICTTVYEYEDHLSKWIPAVKVELPRLAPRPRSRGSGSTAVRRRASRGSVGGDEGWETREYKGVRSSGGIGSNGKDLLVSYLEELRSTAAGQRRWDLHRLPAMPAEGARYGELYGGVARQTEPDDEHGCGEAENTWKDLEMFPDEEELRMLSTAEGAGDEAAAGAASPTSSTSSAISLLPATDTLTNAVPSVLPMNTALVLLSADSAALGVWLGGRLVRHKVLTGYTVRQSAGGSQARRDRRTRGGGGRSVGAALRRAEAVRLWQATAARLTDWVSELSYCDILIRSGDTRVFAQLYEARRPAAPIGPRDPRWEGAGMSVPRPRLRDLFAVYGRLCTGRVKNLLSMNGSESKPPSRG